MHASTIGRARVTLSHAIIPLLQTQERLQRAHTVHRPVGDLQLARVTSVSRLQALIRSVNLEMILTTMPSGRAPLRRVTLAGSTVGYCEPAVKGRHISCLSLRD